MGRKNITPQRQEEILDAFEICIEKFGLANCSTRRIAEEANIKQPLIAHYFGSKDAMISALVERIINHYITGFQNAVKNSDSHIDAVLDYLFDSGLKGNKTKRNLIGQLVSNTINDEKLKNKIQTLYCAFLEFGERELHKLFPNSKASNRKKCTYGILCLIAGNDVILSVDIPWSNRKLARKNAEELLTQLHKEEK